MKADGKQEYNSPELTKKYSGLFNQGNTCYLNSLLQCLFMTSKFREILFQWKYNEKNHGNIKDCIPFQLQKLFARLNNKYFIAESTEGLTKSFQWNENQVSEQHDIQELCRVLFDALEKSTENDFINYIFEGSTENVVKCLVCNFESIKTERFLDMSLPIRNEFDKIYNTSLEMALLNFLKEEYLTNDNKYFCEQCNTKVEAKKFSRFKTLPEILFIQLNRFDYDYISLCRKKIHDRVTFPDRLDFNNFLNHSYNEVNSIYTDEVLKNLALMNNLISSSTQSGDNDSIYNLYAIVIHAGNATNGHYYSYIKSFEDNNWYKFEDDKVYLASNEELFNSFGGADNSYNSSTAYCLLYKKTSSKTCDEFIIPQQINEIILEENDKIAETLRIREERLNTLKLKFILNSGTIYLEIKKQNTIKDLKIKLIEKGLVTINDSIEPNLEEKLKLFRIRLYHLNKKTEIYDNNDQVLEEAGFHHSNKTYTIEVRTSQEIFEEFDPNSMCFNIFIWNNAYSVKIKEAEEKGINLTEEIFQSIQFKINKKASLRLFKDQITQFLLNKHNLSAKEDKLIVFTKIDYGVNNFKIKDLFNIDNISQELKNKKLPYKNIIENELSNLNFFDQMNIYIEEEASIQNSKFNIFFEDKGLNVKILFNNIWTKNIKPKVGAYEFDNEIEIKKTKTLRSLKKRISEIINYDCNEFIMKKNSHNGSELKNLNETIDKYTSLQLKIFLEVGQPMKESEIKLNISICEEDHTQFNILPYKILKIADFSVDSLWSFKEMKKSIRKEIENMISLFDEKKPIKSIKITNEYLAEIIPRLKSLQWERIFIRDFINDKPTLFYNQNLDLKDYDIQTGKQIILFNVKNDKLQFEGKKTDSDAASFKVISKEKMHLTLRKWDPSSWSLSEPQEIFIPRKNYTYFDLNNDIISKMYNEIEVSYFIINL